MCTTGVHRPHAIWRDRFRSYEIHLDEQPVGEISAGEQAQLDVEPGHHTVEVKVGWAGRKPLKLTFESGQTISLDVRPNGPAPFAILELAWPRAWLRLRVLAK